MSLYLVHRQTETSPAEYQADNPFTCVRCNFHGDLDDDSHWEVAEGTICRDCIHRCVECGVILEGESAESDLYLVFKLAYCGQCFRALLVPDWEIENGKVVWR